MNKERLQAITTACVQMARDAFVPDKSQGPGDRWDSIGLVANTLLVTALDDEDFANILVPSDE